MSSQFMVSVMVAGFIVQAMLLGTAYLILLERKIASWVQDRVGPNRTNLSFGVLPIKHHCWGLGQPLADGLKFLLKEDYTPKHVDRTLFMLAPVLAVMPAMIGWGVIPWGGYLQWGEQVLSVAAAPVNIGVIYILAVGSLAVYGVVLGGYASNNKYSFIGGMRATAQMVSYEVPMSLCVLIVILVSSSANAQLIVFGQANGMWNIVSMPFLAVIFFTCSLAECNRAPFDLAECEQELVGGFHTEYSSMKFALFFLGEYMHMITASAFFVLLFLGAWDLPIIQEPVVGGLWLVLLKVQVFLGKVVLMLALMMLVRWTLPRFRFDQLMRLCWRILIPVTLVLLLGTTFVVAMGWSKLMLLVLNVALFGLVVVVGPKIPENTRVNRRVALRGSRFSAPAEVG